MIVKELRELLSKFPDNLLVVSSIDSEGNKFTPMDSDHSKGVFDEVDWEFHDPSDPDEDMENLKRFTSCIVLYPSSRLHDEDEDE